MVKQTKTFKKGNVTKKALSAILAASMVMTSSSFVMAAPVELEDVAVEAAAVDVVEDVDAGEEQVGVVEAVQGDFTIEVNGGASLTYNGKDQTPNVSVVYKKDTPAAATLVKDQDFTVTFSNAKNVGTAVARIEFNKGTYDCAPIEKEFQIVALPITDATVTATGVKSFIYNGKVQKPDVVVELKVNATDTAKTTLVEGVDYKVEPVSGSDLKTVKPDDQTLKIVGINNFSETATQTVKYDIQKATFSADTMDVKVTPTAYTNSLAYSDVIANLTVKEKTTKTVFNNYNVYYKDSTGEYKLLYTSAGAEAFTVGKHDARLVSQSAANYEDGGIIDFQYEIVKDTTFEMALKDATVTGLEGTIGTGLKTSAYTGTNKFSTITLAGTALQPGKDYEIVTTEADWTNAGEYVLEIKGLNKYDGSTVSVPVTVPAKAINNGMISAVAGKTSDGKDATVTVVVTDSALAADKQTLKNGKDYSYTTRVVGTKTFVDVKGLGNYTTEESTNGVESVEVAPTSTLPISHEIVTAKVNKTVAYTGKAITLSGADIEIVENIATPKTLKINEDYRIIGYKNNTNAGTAYVTVKGIGKYSETRKIPFTITGESFENTFALDLTEAAKKTTADTVDAAKNAVKVRYKANSAAFSNTYYDVKMYYGNETTEATGNLKAGTYTVKVEAKDCQYAGTLVGTVTFGGQDISKVITSVAKIADQKYTGSPIEPTLVISSGATKLTLGKDYTVTYKNNVESGVATAVITGIGKYSGTVAVTFNIVGQMNQDVQILAAQVRDIQNRTMNSKATTVKFEADKAPKTAVTYTSSDENVVKVDETGKITYTGLGEATITVKAAETEKYKAAEVTMTVKVGLAKPSFTPFSKNNAFTLTSSTVKGAEKFEVEYATKKDFSNSKTKTFETTSAGKVRQVKVSAGDKKTYYVRVRAISGTTKSAWSATKTVATK